MHRVGDHHPGDNDVQLFMVMVMVIVMVMVLVMSKSEIAEVFKLKGLLLVVPWKTNKLTWSDFSAASEAQH